MKKSTKFITIFSTILLMVVVVAGLWYKLAIKDEENNLVSEYSLAEEKEPELIETYTTEEIAEWREGIENSREAQYSQMDYMLAMGDYEVETLDDSFEMLIEYGRYEDNTQQLKQTVGSLINQFGGEDIDYIAVGSMYDDTLMQGVNIIENKTMRFYVVYDGDSTMYVNVELINESTNPTMQDEVIVIETEEEQ